MKTILVPTDFSETARNATQYAIHLAKDMKAKVLLMHVYHVPIAPAEEPTMAFTSEELQQRNEELLKKEADLLMEKTGVEVNYLAQIGLAVDEIIDEEKNADLIVMGMQGASRISEMVLGSITTSVLRKAEKPLIVVPEKAEYKKPEIIVYACDFDPRTNKHTLDALKNLVTLFHSKIIVMNVKRKNELVTAEESNERMKVENQLTDVEHIYYSQYFPENNDLVNGINDFVKSHEADMIAMVPHKHNLIERLFHRSISKQMAFHTNIPIIALPDNRTTMATYL